LADHDWLDDFNLMKSMTNIAAGCPGLHHEVTVHAIFRFRSGEHGSSRRGPPLAEIDQALKSKLHPSRRIPHARRARTSDDNEREHHGDDRLHRAAIGSNCRKVLFANHIALACPRNAAIHSPKNAPIAAP
jgi:hypothetical protein